MKVGAMIRAFVCVLAASFPLMAFAGPAPDADSDGIPDVLDSCMTLPSAGPLSCDTDQDGYGNPCDGDFDNSGLVNANDFSNFFLPDFAPPGLDSGVGSDMDCSGLVNANDFSNFFLPQFAPPGTPGPSGLACAGSVPCK
jgi:hypothetical protein